MALLPKAVDSVASSREAAAKAEADRRPRDRCGSGLPAIFPMPWRAAPYLVALAADAGGSRSHALVGRAAASEMARTR